jgi:predicted DNA-binding transcriptional regulator YafY
MRAYRLLSILLLLQAQPGGALSAGDIATRLGVSRRTVYRDMDALSAAGVPVYAERGNGGGWRLLDTNQHELPGIDEAQLRALQLGGRRDLQEDLGLRGAADLIWARLTDISSAPDERLLIDEAGWRGRREGDDLSNLPTIQRAVFSGQRLTIDYERNDGPVTRIVDPLGLVAKGSIWYLVAAVDGAPRTYRVSRVRDATLLPEPVSRPGGFRLRDWWQAQQQDFVERLPRYSVKALVRGPAIDWLRFGGWYATIERQSEPREDGFRELTIRFDALDRALAWAFSSGRDVILLDPPDLRDALANQARVVLDHLGEVEGCGPGGEDERATDGM